MLRVVMMNTAESRINPCQIHSHVRFVLCMLYSVDCRRAFFCALTLSRIFFSCVYVFYLLTFIHSFLSASLEIVPVFWDCFSFFFFLCEKFIFTFLRRKVMGMASCWWETFVIEIIFGICFMEIFLASQVICVNQLLINLREFFTVFFSNFIVWGI